MSELTTLEQGRAAYAARAWGAAHRLLSSADDDAPLGPDDLSTLATAAYLDGDHNHCTDSLARAFQGHSAEGAVDRAAGCAYWLAFVLLNRGEHAQAHGWVSRATRLLDEDGRDCVERAYLEMLGAITLLMQGDAPRALAAIDGVIASARRYDDANLVALGELGKGQALIALDQTEEGLELLDGVMVLATSGELSEIVAGLAYCAVISVCQDILDVRRAREWTSALSRWCNDQPDLVPYSGHCLIHRSELAVLEGDWEAAWRAAQAAHERFTMADDWGSQGHAYYREGELHRLRGELDAADAAFRETSLRGHDPQPGLALLRLAQGRADAAVMSIERMLQEPLDSLRRARLLAVYVEVTLAAGNVEAARQASAELSETAARFAPSMLKAVALAADGAVRLATGDAPAALVSLRSALALWNELDAPYERARTRELVGRAYLALGDEDGAELELHAVAGAYRALGAAADLARVAGEGATAEATGSTAGLSPREVEVLRLVAAGKTNRAIAGELVLSEKTVARHLSNIFVKLDVSSRSAATAFAYENRLV